MDSYERKVRISRPVRFSSPSLLGIGVNRGAVSPLPSPVERPISPFGDTSVQGYATDIKPKYHGAKEIVSVIQDIEACGVSCCVVGEAALIYYGAKRVMFDWLICVQSQSLDYVNSVLHSQSAKYESFKPSVLNVFGSLNSRFPRFKLVGQATFFVLMSSQACHLQLTPQDVEYDRWIRIPYPKLPAYVQSLLDTWNLTDLEDLVDGMNLTEQWGSEHLDLNGTVDQAWACWRETMLAERELNPDELPRWSESKRAIWTKVSSSDAKKKRQGWKARPDQLTRFWSYGQIDPRERYKDYT